MLTLRVQRKLFKALGVTTGSACQVFPFQSEMNGRPIRRVVGFDDVDPAIMATLIGGSLPCRFPDCRFFFVMEKYPGKED
jgi:hypothetical protein